MEIKIILYIVTFILIFILYYKEYYTEKYTDFKPSEITTAIQNIYNDDKSNFDYLALLIENIQTKKLPFVINGDISIDNINYFNLFPKGSIVIYNSNTPPSGWVICDGNNGTPDLRGKFVRMWNNNLSFDQNGMYNYDINNIQYNENYKGISIDNKKGCQLKHNFGEYGGTDIYKIKNINELPKHTHTISTDPDHSHSFSMKQYHKSFDGDDRDYHPLVGDDNGDRNIFIPHTITLYSTNNHTHKLSPYGKSEPNFITNQPPYYVLTYIMRL